MLGIRRTLLYVGGLMLAIGGPVTMFSTSDFVAGVKHRWFSSPTTASTTNSPPSAAAAASTDSASPGYTAPPTDAAADALPTPGLDEALRFDTTIERILRRWPRVSTGLPYLQLQGYRVPLMTGAGVADVAGSLTYYFNAQQQVARITLRGVTGDPGALVRLLTDRYHFTRRLTNDPGMVLYETVNADQKSIGTLKIHSASVIRAARPHGRFEIDLVLDRPE